MIIQLSGPSDQGVHEATRSLQALTQAWGHATDSASPPPPASSGRDDSDKVIDPVSAATLILSVPSAALAVLDLADRIRKRKRATEVIDHARQLAKQQVTATLVHQQQAIELSSLTPDQLLDLIADEEKAN